MMTTPFRTLFILIALMIPAHGFAQEQPVTAISMHGTADIINQSALPYANPNATKGGTLTQCTTGTFDTLNDNTMKGSPADGLYLLNDPLMRRVWSEPFTLQGVIAQSVTLPKDRSFIIFHINPNAQFHDGTPITSADVQFSFETLRDKGKPNTRAVYKLVKNVTVPDTHTIRFDFDDQADRETPMILAMMPIYSKQYWGDKEFDATTLTAPLGNGPYKITAIDAGKSITYEKVTDYWTKDNKAHIGHYNFDRLTFDYYRDEQIALEAFKAGDCDIRREGNPAKWQANYHDDEGYIKETLSHSRPEPTKGFIMNTRRAPFNDIRVRQAMVLAFDFDWVNRALLYGQAKQINSIFSNSALSADTPKPSGDKRDRLKQADALLTDAGWPITDGKRFETTLLLRNPQEEKIALGYKRNLARLGITLNIRTLDTTQFVGALNEYDYDMISWRWINTLSPGSEQSVYWGCDAAKTNGSRNYAGLCDGHVESIITALSDARDYKTLSTLAKQLDTAIMNQSLFVPLYYTGVDYMARWPNIHHPKAQSLYGLVLETWWREQE